jgi:hypothetical protein
MIKKPRKRGGYSPARGLKKTNPQWVVAPEKKKKLPMCPMTPSGIEHTTFQFVAQSLIQLLPPRDPRSKDLVELAACSDTSMWISSKRVVYLIQFFFLLALQPTVGLYFGAL